MAIRRRLASPAMGCLKNGLSSLGSRVNTLLHINILFTDKMITNPTKYRWIPRRELAQVLATTATMLLFYTVARILFYIINSEAFTTSMPELLSAFTSGLRFDLATFTYASAIGIPALALGFGIHHRPIVRKLTLLALYLPYALTLFLNMADIAYFNHSYRRQTNELFTMFSETINAASSEALYFWWLTLLTLALLTGLYYSLKLVLRHKTEPSLSHTGASSAPIWLGRVVLLLALCATGALMARGGMQDRPLRTGMAFVTDNPALGQLGLNSGFSILWSRLHQEGQILNLMPDETALAITRQLTSTHNDKFLDKRYPFLKVSESQTLASKAPWNVVIFIMESWNASQTGAINSNGPYPDVTPVFDSLAREGLLFTRFYSSGDRSIHAFPAIVASLPNLTGNGIINTALETCRARGLGTILKERGYKTIFAMGAEPSSMGFDSYAKASGFDEHFSRDTYRDEFGFNDENQWGTFDENFLEFIDGRLAVTPEPFALTFFSLTAHSPYEVPTSFSERFPIDDDTNIDGAESSSVRVLRQRRALQFADYSLGEFFKAARKRTYFDRTIFVITGDHTGWEGRTSEYPPLQRQQVPLLIYAPALVEAGVDSLPANQVDILPTILSLLGAPALNSSMGQSLVDSNFHRISFTAKAELKTFLYDSMAVRATSTRINGVFGFRSDSLFKTNLLLDSSMADITKESIKAYKAYLQTGMNALVNDKIFPPPPELRDILKQSNHSQ